MRVARLPHELVAVLGAFVSADDLARMRRVAPLTRVVRRCDATARARCDRHARDDGGRVCRAAVRRAVSRPLSAWSVCAANGVQRAAAHLEVAIAASVANAASGRDGAFRPVRLQLVVAATETTIALDGSGVARLLFGDLYAVGGAARYSEPHFGVHLWRGGPPPLPGVRLARQMRAPPLSSDALAWHFPSRAGAPAAARVVATALLAWATAVCVSDVASVDAQCARWLVALRAVCGARVLLRVRRVPNRQPPTADERAHLLAADATFV